MYKSNSPEGMVSVEGGGGIYITCKKKGGKRWGSVPEEASAWIDGPQTSLCTKTSVRQKK